MPTRAITAPTAPSVPKIIETNAAGTNPGLSTVQVADPVFVPNVTSSAAVVAAHAALGPDAGRDPFTKAGT